MSYTQNPLTAGMTPQQEIAAYIGMFKKRNELVQKYGEIGALVDPKTGAVKPGTPPQAITEWNAWLDQAETEGGRQLFRGDLSPAAKALAAQVDPTTGKTMLLNPNTGQYDIEKKGYWSNWESWVQLAAGAALGGVTAAGLAGANAVPGAVTPSVEGVTAGSGVVPAAVGTGTTAATAGSKLADFLKSPSALGLFGNITDTLLTTSANSKAAEQKAAADKYAADLLDAANKRAELFSRQTAENQWQNTEGTRKANYDMWAEREGRFSNLGAALGLAPRNTPKYSPGIDPHFTDWDPNNPLPSPSSPSTTTPPNTTTPPAAPASTWDPNKFAAIVGRPPTQAETAFYMNVPTWEIDVRNAAGRGAPTTPGQYGAGYTGAR